MGPKGDGKPDGGSDVSGCSRAVKAAVSNGLPPQATRGPSDVHAITENTMGAGGWGAWGGVMSLGWCV
jgi:hypothetical protein